MKNNLLNKSLRANAVFSATTGSALLFASVPLSSWLGIEMWVSIGLGLGLIGFAGILMELAREPRPSLVRIVVLADIAWVVGAVIVIAVFLGVLSVLLGETVFFRSASLVWYVFIVVAVFVGVILAYEEPTLRRQFGESYARYVSSVRRWIPGRPYRG